MKKGIIKPRTSKPRPFNNKPYRVGSTHNGAPATAEKSGSNRCQPLLLALNPRPETQNPKPKTQNPEPKTLNPKP